MNTVMIRQALRRILRPQRTVPPRDQRWDSTEEEVADLPRLLRSVAHDDAEDGPAELGYRPRHGSSDTATGSTVYIGQHRPEVVREWTAEFRAIARRETGREVAAVGPREADIHGRRIPGAPWERADVLMEVP